MSVVSHRRTLHRIPEINFELPKTIAYVESVLSPLHCTITHPIDGSVCAFFDAGHDHAIAFRADMDALSLQEDSAAPYCSTHAGKMHACGHDGHTAMLLGLAAYLSENLDSLPHNVLLLFQPAEETTGGAKPLCQSGVLSQYTVQQVFGLHLWPNLEKGKIFTCSGAMMAQSNEIDITITGKSVHLSQAANGLDAMKAGMDYVQRAYAMMDAIDPAIPRILRFGKFDSGTVRNAISGHTHLLGSLRTYDAQTFAHCSGQLHTIAKDLEAQTGCTFHVIVRDGYAPVWNHEELYQTLCDQLGADAPLPLPAPSLAGEDFSFYQKEVPSVFFFLGLGKSPELHAITFDFDDEAVLPCGVDFFKKLVYLHY